ncbi:hypothetical protein K3G39_14640 [Pontibacter sp. HSC-14F20]|uniref:hypothetical protein n=1 Tax=Pontibacter sp. HSC-14F20 TaxID=2864136 RepID=UPI001C735E89|nr:hypothetical protein [Pontibacter sp. HSC-14F20]MBX0334477.1 hypothetical protein [Pontibacter sp. HSC-14F20]
MKKAERKLCFSCISSGMPVGSFSCLVAVYESPDCLRERSRAAVIITVAIIGGTIAISGNSRQQHMAEWQWQWEGRYGCWCMHLSLDGRNEAIIRSKRKLFCRVFPIILIVFWLLA